MAVIHLIIDFVLSVVRTLGRKTFMPIALFVLPVISTLAGGWLALRAQRYLPLLLAVGAGLLLGTAFLDRLPDAMLMARRTGQLPSTVLAIALANRCIELH
jgi:hypothetical protein